MGRGSRTHESDVSKERTQRSEIGSGSGGSGAKEEATESCLFSFEGDFRTTEQNSSKLTESSSVVIVPHVSDAARLEIYINGKNLGEYKGSYLKKLADCIKRGYTYEGSVKKITQTQNGSTIRFQLQGYGR